jgi:hypothetical protein
MGYVQPAESLDLDTVRQPGLGGIGHLQEMPRRALSVGF